MIIDPGGGTGRVQTDQPEIVVATLDLSDVIPSPTCDRRARARRPELYGEVSSVKVNES